MDPGLGISHYLGISRSHFLSTGLLSIAVYNISYVIIQINLVLSSRLVNSGHVPGQAWTF